MQAPTKSGVLLDSTSKAQNMKLTSDQSSQDHGTNRNKWSSQVCCQEQASKSRIHTSLTAWSIHPTGNDWYKAFFQRVKALPEYSDIVETKSGRATDTAKLMYYNTGNINYWYDKMIKILCDDLKIAERTTGEDAEAEIVWTGDKNRILFTDETAIKDRNESSRISQLFKKRITRSKNVAKGRRRRYAKDKRGSLHETATMGYNLMGDIVPPVWVINRRTIDDNVR